MPRLLLIGVVLITAACGEGDTTPPPDRNEDIEAVREILEGLEQAIEDDPRLDFGKAYGEAVSAIEPRLELFELRHGRTAPSTTGYATIKRSATRLLDAAYRQDDRVLELARAGAENRSGQIDEEQRSVFLRGLMFKPDMYAPCHAILLELAGHSKQATTLVLTADPEYSFDEPPSIGRRRMLRAAMRISLRAARYEEALSVAKRVLVDENGHAGLLRAAEFWVRRAFLLERSGRTEEAVALYQRCVDLKPHATHTSLARDALVRLGRLVQPTAERIWRRYGESRPQLAALALAEHRFPEARYRLEEMLRVSNGWSTRQVLTALEGRGYGRDRLGDGPGGAPRTSLLVLGLLARLGDRSRLIEALGREYATGTTCDEEADLLDAELSIALEDGPELPWLGRGISGWGIGKRVAESWQQWLRERDG